MAPFGHTCVGLTLTELVLSALFWAPNLFNCIFTTLRKDSPKVAQKLRKGVSWGVIQGVVHVRQILHHCSVPSALLETHGMGCCHLKKPFTFVFIGDTGMEPGTFLMPLELPVNYIQPPSPFFLLGLGLTKLPGLTLNSVFVQASSNV